MPLRSVQTMTQVGATPKRIDRIDFYLCVALASRACVIF